VEALASRLALAALALTLSIGAGAAHLYGTVVAIADGDTLTVLDVAQRQHKVRLSAIDAPERRQAYGERAKQHLVRLAHGRSVLVDWHKRDRYGRIVGRVLLRQCAHVDCSYAQDVALEQLRAGFAWHFVRYASEQPLYERQQYAGMEREARARREGLWQQPEPVPPWLFRKNGTDPDSRDRRLSRLFGSSYENC
jgi:endonuclease YncB( thermonuclease family)